MISGSEILSLVTKIRMTGTNQEVALLVTQEDAITRSCVAVASIEG